MDAVIDNAAVRSFIRVDGVSVHGTTMNARNDDVGACDVVGDVRIYRAGIQNAI
jgi:hypothetical protein